MKPNLTDMKRFKRYFHADVKATFQMFSKTGKRSTMSRHLSGLWNERLSTALINANKIDRLEVGMTINRCAGNGRRAEDVTEVLALFVDCDDGKMSTEKLLDLPIPPHLVVQTSIGNYHAYWRIAECRNEQFKSIQQALASRLDTDSSVCDLGRTMRVPGTINWKRDQPFLCKIVHIDDSAEPIALERFVQKMLLNIKANQPQPTPSKKPTGRLLVSPHESKTDMHSRIKAALQGVPPDDRWLWFRFGMAIHSADSSQAGYETWKAWSRKSAKFDEKDQRKTWKAFKKNGGINIHTLFWLANKMKAGSGSQIDEMSMAEMFAESSVHQLRFNRDTRDWLYYDGVTWKVDSQAPQRAVRRFIDGLSQGDRGEMSESIRRFRSAAAMKGIVAQAELMDEVHISAHEFDQNHDLLAVKNGVVNLRTGIFRPALAEDYLRRKANVEYSETAECPTWKKFMRSITCEDKELYRYIRRALGYTLFGSANLQLFFLAIGSGGNGKGTLMRTVQKIMGDYATSVAPNLLTSAYSGNVNGPTPALAKLYGARMVVCSELPTGRKLDDAFIKQYAGGDEITARATYGDVFSFTPEGKLWLSANEPPEIRANDEAMWRRVKPIPFNAKFEGGRRDDDIEKKFIAEYPGILMWLVRGAQEYLASGLGSCPAVETLEARMQQDADSILAWLSERCLQKVDSETQSSIAYDDYLDFMRKIRRKALNPSAFRTGLEYKGVHHKRKKNGNYYKGFCIQER